MWALKQLNLNWDDAITMRLGQLNEMDEFHLNAYERADLYKERMKKYHDWRIIQQNFQKGNLVLLFNSKLKLFPGKLKSKWSGPFRISQVYSSGVVELENNDGDRLGATYVNIGDRLGATYVNIGDKLGAAYVNIGDRLGVA
ncbi:hypothetical protein BC332_28446 [Capsicum chinense]|nr:hypothetical protein BC332_28446 [Capsicum chinense]